MYRIISAITGLLAFASIGQAQSSTIVISQIYTQGGNAGAPWRNDYIELFNRGTTSVNVTNWTVQFAGPGGSIWSKTDLAGVINPGQFFLVQEAGTGANGSLLPPADATGTINLTPANGKVALVMSPTVLPNALCFPTGSNGIQDLVGYGPSAGCFEGAGTAPSPSVSTAVFRIQNGCTDTDNNNADFVVQTPPAPRNSSAPPSPCLPNTGACCINNSCSVTTPANCLASSGSYNGDGSICTPMLCTPPSTGACCVTGGCLITTAGDCAISGGTYYGDGSECLPTTCQMQSLDIDWFTIDCGGSMSVSGGSFELAGTIGQADARSEQTALTGGGFSLVGGFWQSSEVPCNLPGDLNFDALRNGQDIQPFLNCVLNGGTGTGCTCADMNADGVVGIPDVAVFVNVLTGA